jgi:hypothetical protein
MDEGDPPHSFGPSHILRQLINPSTVGAGHPIKGLKRSRLPGLSAGYTSKSRVQCGLPHRVCRVRWLYLQMLPGKNKYDRGGSKNGGPQTVIGGGGPQGRRRKQREVIDGNDRAQDI